MAQSSKKLAVKKERKAAVQAEAHLLPFERLHREIDRLFDDFGRVDWRLPFSRRDFDFNIPWPKSEGWGITPAMDLTEKDDEFEVTVELPGMDEKDIDIRISNGSLKISGDKTDEKEEKNMDYHLSERQYGSIRRTISLPEGVDADKIEAAFSKGVLNVKLPKSTEARKAEKKISVKAA